ncbi:AF4/FMR2 family member 4-like, partial [Cyclospora cayetanensis]|uniref:AF4/FMR2 family member 4-like n=1 Tax=Cyclospora cayetanensis TaxID=88456 RepID=A0A6P6RWI4_9EIME
MRPYRCTLSSTYTQAICPNGTVSADKKRLCGWRGTGNQTRGQQQQQQQQQQQAQQQEQHGGEQMQSGGGRTQGEAEESSLPAAAVSGIAALTPEGMQEASLACTTRSTESSSKPTVCTPHLLSPGAASAPLAAPPSAADEFMLFSLTDEPTAPEADLGTAADSSFSRAILGASAGVSETAATSVPSSNSVSVSPPEMAVLESFPPPTPAPHSPPAAAATATATAAAAAAAESASDAPPLRGFKTEVEKEEFSRASAESPSAQQEGAASGDGRRSTDLGGLSREEQEKTQQQQKQQQKQQQQKQQQQKQQQKQQQPRSSSKRHTVEDTAFEDFGAFSSALSDSGSEGSPRCLQQLQILRQ